MTVLVAGCAWFPKDEDELQKFREPRYNSEEPIQLKVNKVEVISEFTPTFKRPNVEHLFPISIEKPLNFGLKTVWKPLIFPAPKSPK